MNTLLKRTLAVGFAGALAATAASPTLAQSRRDLGAAALGFGAGVIVGSTIAPDYDAYAYAPGPSIVVEPDAYAFESDAVIVQRRSPSWNYNDQLPHRERVLRGTDY